MFANKSRGCKIEEYLGVRRNAQYSNICKNEWSVQEKDKHEAKGNDQDNDAKIKGRDKDNDNDNDKDKDKDKDNKTKKLAKTREEAAIAPLKFKVGVKFRNTG
jgi:hypothetical protein